jgi:hypothetical protein
MVQYAGEASIWIGWDPRPAEMQAYAVAKHSISKRLSLPLPIKPVVLNDLRGFGLYTRPTERRDGRLHDVISDAPMSTEFAISRFLVPTLANRGMALFVDADVMARTNVCRIFDGIDKSKAVHVVKHNYRPTDALKMDGQVQTTYERKNWSSVVLWNCDHPAVKALTPDVVNKERGLWLHQFRFLKDDDIGELDPSWNYLVGHSPEEINPALVHFTDGTPSMEGYEDVEYANEWRTELERWAA